MKKGKFYTGESVKIGIDLDGVVIDSETTFRTYEEIYDLLHLKGNHLVDRTEPKYQWRYNWTQEQKDDFAQQYYLKVSRESGLMSGFLAVFQLLKAKGFEFVVITARGEIIKAMKDDAERVLRENDIKFDKYYWNIKDKVEICQKEKIDYMIDDDWRIIQDLANHKIKTLYFRDTGLKKLPQNEYIKEVNNWGDVFRFFYELDKNE